jgi:AraC-like DNA-binding protein
MRRPITILRDEDRGEWELITARPHAALRPHVARYTGWLEKRATPLQRREIPSQYIPLIINFGSPIRISHAADPTRWDAFDSFITGAYDSYVVVETDAGAGGIQIDFTLLGARQFIGAPLDGLVNRAVSLDEIVGARARDLTAALYDERGWEARFDLLDRVLAARLAETGALSTEIVWAWNRLVGTDGQIAVGSLSGDLGWSRRRFIARFKEHVGLAPKTFARVLRFQRAVEVLKTGGADRLADVALDCGYYDQPHFDRDFRVFAGVTPTDLLRTLRPDGGFAAEA